VRSVPQAAADPVVTTAVAVTNSDAPERESICNLRNAERVCVRQNVCSFKQFTASQATDGTVVLIRAYHSISKLSLM
jgi:hypothetical protein